MKRIHFILILAGLSPLLPGAIGDAAKGKDLYNGDYMCRDCHARTESDPIANVLPRLMEPGPTDPIESLAKRLVSSHTLMDYDILGSPSDPANMAAYLKQLRDATKPSVTPITDPWKAEARPTPVGGLSFRKPGGGRINLSAYRGKVVLLAVGFGANNDSQNLALLMQEWSAQYGPQGFQALMVTINGEDDAQNLSGQFKLSYPVGYVTDSAPEYKTLLQFLRADPEEPFDVPSVAVIDRAGMVQYYKSRTPHRSFFIDADSGNALLAIRTLLGGTAPPEQVLKIDPDVRRLRIDGTVLVQLTVGPDGKPTDVQVTRPLNPTADDLAIEAVKLWRFIPAMRDGKIISTRAVVEMNFKLVDDN